MSDNYPHKPNVLEYVQVAEQLRLAADALEDAQRAKQHLWGLRTYWGTMSDAERREDVDDAYEALCRIYHVQAQRESVS